MLLKGGYDGIKGFLKGRFGVIGDIRDNSESFFEEGIIKQNSEEKAFK